MIEIMPSDGFNKVIDALHIADAKETYRYSPTPQSYWISAFSIWQVPEEALKTLSAFSNDDEWSDKFFGQWWRYAENTNVADSADYYRDIFFFGDKSVFAWRSIKKDESAGEDYIKLVNGEADKTNITGRSYLNPLQYCVEELGASTPTNVNAICAGLAKLNHMSLSDFFKTYMEVQS